MGNEVKKDCYLGIKGKKYGPLSEQDVRKLYDAKKINGDTKFARVGDKEWISLAQSGIISVASPVMEDSLPYLPQDNTNKQDSMKKQDGKKKMSTGGKIIAVLISLIFIIVGIWGVIVGLHVFSTSQRTSSDAVEPEGALFISNFQIETNNSGDFSELSFVLTNRTGEEFATSSVNLELLDGNKKYIGKVSLSLRSLIPSVNQFAEVADGTSKVLTGTHDEDMTEDSGGFNLFAKAEYVQLSIKSFIHSDSDTYTSDRWIFSARTGQPVDPWEQDSALIGTWYADDVKLGFLTFDDNGVLTHRYQANTKGATYAYWTMGNVLLEMPDITGWIVNDCDYEIKGNILTKIDADGTATTYTKQSESDSNGEQNLALVGIWAADAYGLLIFYDNGEYASIGSYDSAVGTYSVEGNRLTLEYSDNGEDMIVETVEHELNGSMLNITMGDELLTLTRLSDTTSSSIDPALFGVWESEDETVTFYENGRFSNEHSRETSTGDYWTVGGWLAALADESASASTVTKYEVSDTTLTLINGDKRYAYTKKAEFSTQDSAATENITKISAQRITYKGIEISNLFGSVDDVVGLFGPASYVGEHWLGYDDGIEFMHNNNGDITSLDCSDLSLFETEGTTLDKNRAVLVSLLGNPDVENEYGHYSIGYYHGKYKITVYLDGPDDEPIRIGIGKLKDNAAVKTEQGNGVEGNPKNNNITLYVDEKKRLLVESHLPMIQGADGYYEQAKHIGDSYNEYYVVAMGMYETVIDAFKWEFYSSAGELTDCTDTPEYAHCVSRWRECKRILGD